MQLQRRYEQMRKSLDQQKFELEERRKAFEKEKAAFDLLNKDDDAFKRMTMDNNSKEYVSFLLISNVQSFSYLKNMLYISLMIAI